MLAPFFSRIALLAALHSLTTIVSGDSSNLNPSGQGCIDSKGFLDCYQAQEVQLTGCVDFANKTCHDNQNTYNNCLQGCYGAQLAGNIGCWIQSCWNQVYSCEYQAIAIQYISGTDLVQSSVNIPFYPAPGGVPGRCSCNLGYVYGNQTFIWNPDPCSSSVTGDQELLDNCFCCKDSLTMSNILNECPKSDLSILGIQDIVGQTQNELTPYVQDNCAILDNDNGAQCMSTYQLENAGSTWYNPFKVPSSLLETEALSNLPGTPFTDFGAASFTLKLFPAFTSVITPVPFDAKNAAATGGAIGLNSDNPIETGGTAGGASTAVVPVASGATSRSTGATTSTAATPSKTSEASAPGVSLVTLVYAIIAVMFHFA